MDTFRLAGCLVANVRKEGLPKKMLPAMRLIEGVQCTFLPARGLDKTDLDGDSEHRVTGGKLFDIFVSSDAPNCPHPSIRNRPDGHITGDLFEEIEPGYYAFRAYCGPPLSLSPAAGSFFMMSQEVGMMIGSGLGKDFRSAILSAIRRIIHVGFWVLD